MSSPFIKRPSDDEIEDEIETDSRATSREEFPVIIADRGSACVQNILERSGMSMKPSELEKAKEDKASDSREEFGISFGQDVPDESDGGDLPDVKENEDHYPSGIRLLFLSLGLMAVGLMVGRS